MDKNKAGFWKTMFVVMAGMGVFLSLKEPGGPLTTTYRLTLVLVGVVGYLVMTLRESRRRDLNTSEGEPERPNDSSPLKRDKVPVGRLLIALGIVLAVLVGIVVLARSTAPKQGEAHPAGEKPPALVSE